MKKKSIIKIVFWLIAIVVSTGYWKLTYSVFPLIVEFPENLSHLLLAFFNIGMLCSSIWILLFNVNNAKKKTFLSSWKEDKSIPIVSIIILIVFLPVILFLPSLFNKDPLNYSLLWILLPDFFILWVSYWMFKWWLRICSGNYQEYKQRNKLEIDWETVLFFGLAAILLGAYLFGSSFIFRCISPWNTTASFVVFYIINAILSLSIAFSFVQIGEEEKPIEFKQVFLVSWLLGSIINGFFPFFFLDATFLSGLYSGIVALLIPFVLIFLTFIFCKIFGWNVSIGDWFLIWKRIPLWERETKQEKHFIEQDAPKERKDNSSKNSTKKKILFLGVKNGPDVYELILEELRRKKHEVSLVYTCPADLNPYDVVILHGKEHLTENGLRALSGKVKIIIIPNRKELKNKWKDDPQEGQFVFVLGKDKSISTFLSALSKTVEF